MFELKKKSRGRGVGIIKGITINQKNLLLIIKMYIWFYTFE